MLNTFSLLYVNATLKQSLVLMLLMGSKFLMHDVLFYSGRRAAVEKTCSQYFKGCKEVLDENRKAGKFIDITLFSHNPWFLLDD